MSLVRAGLRLMAQTDRGAITGTITDLTGARVSTATVTSAATAVDRPSKTNDESESSA